MSWVAHKNKTLRANAILQTLPVLSANTARRTDVLREVAVAGQSVEVEAALLCRAALISREQPGRAGIVELTALQRGRVAPVSSAPTRRSQAARGRGVVGQLARAVVFVEHRTRRAGALPDHRPVLALERRLAVGGRVGVVAVSSVHAGVGSLTARRRHVRCGELTALGSRVKGTEAAFVIFLQKRLLALVVQRTAPVGVCVQTVFHATAQGQADTEAGVSVTGVSSAGRRNTCSEERQERARKTWYSFTVKYNTEQIDQSQQVTNRGMLHLQTCRKLQSALSPSHPTPKRHPGLIFGLC